MDGELVTMIETPKTRWLIVSEGIFSQKKKKRHIDTVSRYTQPEKLGTNEYSCSKCGGTLQVNF